MEVQDNAPAGFDIKSILEILNSFGIKATAKDIKNPNVTIY
jgi:hypothetical protein